MFLRLSVVPVQWFPESSGGGSIPPYICGASRMWTIGFLCSCHRYIVSSWDGLTKLSCNMNTCILFFNLFNLNETLFNKKDIKNQIYSYEFSKLIVYFFSTESTMLANLNENKNYRNFSVFFSPNSFTAWINNTCISLPMTNSLPHGIKVYVLTRKLPFSILCHLH